MLTSTNKTIFPFLSLSTVFIVSLLIAGLTGLYITLIFPFACLLFYAGWLNINLSFFLLLLSVPFSFEYNFSPTLGTDIPDEGLMLIVSFLFFAYWLYKPSIISSNTLQHPLLLLLFVHLAWIIITTSASTDLILSAKFLLAKCWYLGAFLIAPLVIFRDRLMIKWSAIILAVSVLLISITSLIRHASDNFSFASVNDSVAPFFRNHVNYSAMLVCMLPVFVSFLLLSKKKHRWLITSILVLLSALFFSYARGAWLALLTGAVAYWLLINRKLIIAFITIVVLTIASVLWLKSQDRYLQFAHDYQTTIFHEDFKQHLVATYKLKDVSTAERFYRWIAGVRMIKENWLVGYGPGTFYENYKPYGVPAFKTWVSENKERSTVHNYFLLLAVEQGIPGLFFFLLLLGAMLYYSQCLYHRIKEPFYKVAAMATGVIVVMITTVNSLSDLIETDKIGSLFFLCLSLLIMIDRNTRDELKPGSHI